jgi:hypothetical protein
MQLVFDCMIFLLTLTRTTLVYLRHRAVRSHYSSSSLLENLVRDGGVYFGYVCAHSMPARAANHSFPSIIFSINLAWALMIMYAPTDLRAIASMYVSPPLFKEPENASLTPSRARTGRRHV